VETSSVEDDSKAALMDYVTVVVNEAFAKTTPAFISELT